jgi:hypothetical protein
MPSHTKWLPRALRYAERGSFLTVAAWHAACHVGSGRRSEEHVSIQISRRHVIAGLAFGFAFPVAAHARVTALKPATFTLEVLDVVGFDPVIRRAPSEGAAAFNLAFRTDPQASARLASQLEEMQGQVLAQFAVHWTTAAGVQSLVINDAYVAAQECAYLSQQNRGQKYDEFGLVVESTHGLWRRADGAEVVSAEYWVTPQGVRWERHREPERGV